MEYKGDDDTNWGWCAWDIPQKVGKETGRLRNKKTSRDHPDYCIIKVSQNTEKSLGDLKSFAVY